MFYIYYPEMLVYISIVWCLVRMVATRKEKEINWKREAQLLLVYVCIIVIARFTFFPYAQVNGRIQPLSFDVTKIYPFRINLEPIVHMNDYVDKRKAMRNFVGNVAMFVPLGIVYPCVFKQLNTHIKVLAAGIGFSLAIELLQIPFYERVTDIDDILMNSAGYIIGYGIYLIFCKGKKKR